MDISKRTASQIGKSNVARSKAHERRVAHLLTEWTGVPFRRRRVEGRDRDTMAVDLVADVIPVEGSFNFSVEAKCGAGFSMDAMLAGPITCKFTEWWHQAYYDATLMKEVLNRDVFPMLFFKPLPQFDWIAVSEAAFHMTYDHGRLRKLTPRGGEHRLDGAPLRPWFPHFSYNPYRELGPVSGNVSRNKAKKELVPLNLPSVVLCRFKDFADAVDPHSAFLHFG